MLDPEVGVETRSLLLHKVILSRLENFVLHKVILSLENFGKTLRKVHYCITKNGAQSMKDSSVLKNACSRANTYIILTSINTLILCTLLFMTSIFVTA